MISEKQRLLCMTFADGILKQVDPPEWFVMHLSRVDVDSDWEGSLLEAGLQSWETFEGSEVFEIYKTKKGGFFINYTDIYESAAWIFIDKPVDYIAFRANVLAPLVALSQQADASAKVKIKI